MTIALAQLSLDDIAGRISTHLRRLEKKDYNARRQAGGDHAHFYCAGARRAGAYISVTYITYQGSSTLTKEQALHYLAGLDAGYEGTHWQYFDQNPLPAAPEKEVRFVALVKGRWGYFLYAVTKRTATRVYGHTVNGTSIHSPTFVDRSDVLKLQAAEEDLAAVNRAVKEREAAVNEAHKRFQQELARILSTKGEFHDVD